MEMRKLGDAVRAAGGTPVFDIEYESSPNWRKIIDEAQYHTQHKQLNKKITVKANIRQLEDVKINILNHTDSIEEVIISIDVDNVKNISKAIEGLRVKVILEIDRVSTLESIEKELERFSGIIVKGNECGGMVGEDSTFILFQKSYKIVKNRVNLFVRGGIGINTAGAFRATGASGVVLDDQLWLMPESPFLENFKKYFRNVSGQEAIPLGENIGITCRVFSKPGLEAVETLKSLLKSIEEKSQSSNEEMNEWEKGLMNRIGWGDPKVVAWPIGQTIGLTEVLTNKYKTTYNLVRAYLYETCSYLTDAILENPLRKDSKLAKSHGTKFPIVQGPMTRVSDTAEFADSVSCGGALPMLALAMMKGEQARELLLKTKDLLESRPWGVGILGFAPKEIRDKQLEAVLEVKPQFALIAGGRPDQARDLEEKGIASYLHVPAPALLKIFIDQGARRFIFEGRECGGHVGPISSLVLWERMIETVISDIDKKYHPEISMLFAGGIHDRISAAFIAALTTKISSKGCKIGILMGTAYLFTKESVSCGAILDGYQKEAIKCVNTVNLETGIGHASRCAVTPFANEFKKVRKDMLVDKYSSDEIKDKLEGLSLGRLRIASKGKIRNESGKFEELKEEKIYNDGMFMIGQAATLRSEITTIDELHEEIIQGGEEMLIAEQDKSTICRDYGPSSPSNIAVIGIGSLLPGSHRPEDFWLNIQNKIDAITEIPRERWDWRIYYDSDKTARDKIYSKWGGFISPISFDPIKFGIPPKSLDSIEPLQLLTLEVVQQALEDSGYADRNFDRENTSVVLGAGGGLADLGQQYATRSEIPRFVENPDIHTWSRLPEWTEESFPGILLNVIAGRTANRFNLGGTNITIDAACASSLAAIDVAVKDLESGHSNLAIAGGIDTIQSPYAYYCFSKSQALSPRGKCFTFDQNADGICISEGLAVVVLKRLEDAERDGDKIYGVIKSVAGSSDGKGLGMTAPKSAGQVRAINRAYKKAGFSPATLGMYEAHGTGTAVGDRTEIQTLSSVMRDANAQPKTCSVGSAKTFVGHTKASAGVVGMVKALQSIYYKTIPPHINVEEPIDEIAHANSPIYINKNIKPWFKTSEIPRRAGISAFGFGGTNFHAVIEEYNDSHNDASGGDIWPFEIITITGKSKTDLIESVKVLQGYIDNNYFKDLSQASYWSINKYQDISVKECIIAFTASSLGELSNDLTNIIEYLQTPDKTILSNKICLNLELRNQKESLAFVFPGQGSQYLEMMQELATYMPEIRQAIEKSEKVLSNKDTGLSIKDAIYPPSSYSEVYRNKQKEHLSQTKIAQPSLAVIETGLYDLLKRLDLNPNFVAGHSFGEYTALYASECIDSDDVVKIASCRGQLMQDSCDKFNGSMLAVFLEHEQVIERIKHEKNIFVANINSNSQTILSGPSVDLTQLSKKLTEEQVTNQMLNVSGAFHSEYVRDAEEALSTHLEDLNIKSPKVPIYCNSTGGIYPNDKTSIRNLLQKQITSSINFKGMIEEMHKDGARIFVEVGPKNILSSFIKETLGDKDSFTISVNEKHDSSLAAFLNAICNLLSRGVEINLSALFNGRNSTRLDPLNNIIKRDSGITLSGGSCTSNNISKGTNGRISPLTLEDINENRNKIKSKKQAQQISSETLPDGKILKKPLNQPIAKETRYLNQNLRNTSELLIAFQSHQETMRKFLAVQESVIGKFLNPSSETNVSHYHDAIITEEDNEILPLSYQINTDVPIEKTLQVNSLDSEQTITPKPIPISSPPTKTASNIENSEGVNTGRAESLSTLVLTHVSDRTGYPIEMLDLDQDIEADLGIDSIKRVEILGGLQKEMDTRSVQLITENMEIMTGIKTLRGLIDYLQPDKDSITNSPSSESKLFSQSEQASSTSIDTESIERIVINIISDRTGYPQEMLDVNQDIEADLGIDSIKRVEILSNIQSALFEENTSLLQENMENMTKLKTISALVSNIQSLLSSAGGTGLGKS